MNRHGVLTPRDFKSLVSANSTTPAHENKENEAAVGLEPTYNGFADRRLTTWLCRPIF